MIVSKTAKLSPQYYLLVTDIVIWYYARIT